MTAKYAIIVPDGAADRPLDCFGGKTIFEAADIPNINAISIEGKQGLVNTIPEGFSPGSDVAQMSLLGYDPRQYYTGRAPLEAAAQGIRLKGEDWVFRCNLVTFSEDKMADHSAGHISSDEGAKLVRDLEADINDPNIRFYPGLSYRHLCVISGSNFEKIKTTPPHDIIDEKLAKHLPKGKNTEQLIAIMERSQKLFEHHDVNRVRRDLHENAVSSVWLWGQGQKATLDSFSKRFGVKGACITAVDLVKGIGKLIHFDMIEVPGATGFFNTNYIGKGQAAVQALQDHDLVFVHIEAPDEAGHAGNAEQKKAALEQIDKFIVGPVHDALKRYDQYRIMVLPDHPTPVETRGHIGDPVPFVMAGTGVKGVVRKPMSEKNATESGFRITQGHELMEYFLKI
ncbi:MAG: cofactor-independent phosphoglycerate mutase [Phycisphaerae bacterium]|nr:cofactor-independent phosphoglycerate mutase [Phycisphaerae bacterium]